MSFRREWINRLRHLVGRAQFDRDLDDEIRFHLETRAAELEKSGLARADALGRARREFGRVTQAQEESREAWRLGWLEDLASDLRHGLRSLGRAPAFALTAVVSLALGMGATTAIYTALDAVLWKPLPVESPENLVNFSVVRDKREPHNALPAAFISQLQKSDIFAGLTVSGADGLSFSYDGRAERVLGEVVSPDYFAVLGVEPILGEGFTPDVRSGHWAAQAVLSYGFWQRRFGGDPGVLGRTIRLNTYPFTIVGVSPPGFFGTDRGTNYELRIPVLPDGADIAQIQEISGSPERWTGLVGRMKLGGTLEQAQAATEAQFQEFLRTTPIAKFREGGLEHVRVWPGAWGYDGNVVAFHTPLYVLMVLVAIVLVIACFNVANMLLARGATRSSEFALRASLGAGRFRLIRQLLTESILLSVLGGALGLAVANWSAGVLFGFLPQGHVSIALDLHPDRRALLFTLAVSLLTGIFFGMLPAWQATRGSTASVLKSDCAASAGGGRGARFRRILVVAQVAFSLLLLVAAGVFVRTLSKLRPTDYGSNPRRVLLFTMKPQLEIYTDEHKLSIAAELIRRVAELPGVESAALAENGPLGSRTDSAEAVVPSRASIRVGEDIVTPGFFASVGIPRIAGRDFDAGDKLGSPPVVIVNQSLVRRFFPKENPIGGRLTISFGDQAASYEIVGVVADTHYYDLHKAEGPFVWLAMGQNPPYMPTLHVRTNVSNTAAMISRIRAQFDAVDKGFPVFNIKTMDSRIEDSLAGERMVANLSGSFGIVALLLAAVGLYGILAYAVSQRTREIGIRMALGAGSRSVLCMIAREALTLVGMGTAAGLLMAMAASQVASHFLPGVSPMEPLIVAACVLGMLLTAGAAVAAPALRACRIDPLTALRHE
jgi:predicted permease